MLKPFQSYIARHQLFNKKHNLLLALSGGVDSVVLAHLLKKSGFAFCIAHCNFQLRDKNSDGDERFCKALAKQLGVPVFVKRFDVPGYCKQHHVSIQMAARQLRYAWFNELLEEHGLDRIVTAHHASDTVETVLINLLRGTGIKGLKGIPAKNGNIVRPLLNVTKEEITAYAREDNIKFRTDKSNAEDKYERNFLRLNIIPQLKTLHPNLEKTFAENTARFAQEAGIVNDFLELKKEQLTQEKGGLIRIDKAILKQEAQGESILHFLLSPYGFNQTQQQNILDNIRSEAVVGKRFQAPDYELTIDREAVLIQPKPTKQLQAISIPSLSELNSFFKVEALKKFTLPEKNELLLNPATLMFPLSIRARQTGDKFKPFGMSRFKLLSDFFKEEKMNAFEKESCRVLVNGNGEIIWVIGYRSDERYKVNKTGSGLLKLTRVD